MLARVLGAADRPGVGRAALEHDAARVRGGRAGRLALLLLLRVRHRSLLLRGRDRGRNIEMGAADIGACRLF